MVSEHPTLQSILRRLAWNIPLAARNENYGSTMTTWGISEEAEVKALLCIPPNWVVAIIMPLRKPLKQLTRLKRKSVEDILYTDNWSGGSAGSQDQFLI